MGRLRSSTTCIIVGLDVCVSTIVFVSSLLSAVNGTTHFIVVCGIGISTMTLALLTSRSELDHLYNWDLVCAFRLFYPSSLVGGAWPDISRCGLWCWNCNNDSANSNINNGARLLTLKILTHHFP